MEEDKLKEQITETKKKISDLRKQGADVFIAHLLVLPLSHKLQVAQATGDQKVTANIQQTLAKIEQELKEASEENFKRTAVHNVEWFCKRMHDAIAAGNRDLALEAYGQLRQAYDTLPAEDKPRYTTICQQLYAELQKR